MCVCVCLCVCVHVPMYMRESTNTMLRRLPTQNVRNISYPIIPQRNNYFLCAFNAKHKTMCFPLPCKRDVIYAF